MKGRLYLGSIREFKILNERDVKCYSITLSNKFDKYMDCLKGLAPSSDLYFWHMKHKDRADFNEGYYEKYFMQVRNSKEAQGDIKTITDLLDSGENVALICFCPDPNRCHRGIIGKWFEKKGYSVDFR